MIDRGERQVVPESSQSPHNDTRPVCTVGRAAQDNLTRDMKRRTLLLAIGGGSTVGTGAVSRLASSRGVSVAVSPDSNALIKLVPISDNAFVETTDETSQISLAVSSVNESNGVNRRAVTHLDNLIRLTNATANTLSISFEQFTDTIGSQDVTADFTLSNDGRTSITGAENAVNVGSGTSKVVGLKIDTRTVQAISAGTLEFSSAVTITAEDVD